MFFDTILMDYKTLFIPPTLTLYITGTMLVAHDVKELPRVHYDTDTSWTQVVSGASGSTITQQDIAGWKVIDSLL